MTEYVSLAVSIDWSPSACGESIEVDTVVSSDTRVIFTRSVFVGAVVLCLQAIKIISMVL